LSIYFEIQSIYLDLKLCHILKYLTGNLAYLYSFVSFRTLNLMLLIGKIKYIIELFMTGPSLNCT